MHAQVLLVNIYHEFRLHFCVTRVLRWRVFQSPSVMDDDPVCPVCYTGVLQPTGDMGGHLVCSVCFAQSQVPNSP